MIYVAFDIGLTGAVAAINNATGEAAVADLPIVATAAGNRIEGRELLDLLRKLVPIGESRVLVAEDVRPRPSGNGNQAGNTMYSQGSLMRSRGAIEAVADIFGNDVHFVQPQTWKRSYGLLAAKLAAGERKPDQKELGRQMALRLFPAMEASLARKKDHNRADALLIARWASLNVEP